MQLDIFEHSRDVMLRNDVLHALQTRSAVAARSAWLRFSAELPLDSSLATLDLLVASLEQDDNTPFYDAHAARNALSRLQQHVEPAAMQMLGDADGAAWMLPVWRRMAQRSSALPYRTDHSEVHAAPLWLRAGDWVAAADAAATIESWRRIPSPLAWSTEARYRAQGLHASWSLLAELAWLAPGRFDALTKRLDDPVLRRLRQAFDAAFEGDGDITDLAWLPAWALTDRPELAAALALAQPGLHTPPERAMRLLLELLGLERQGRHRDVVERRKALRSLQPSLFAAYMKAR